jgi:hypothetical protein
VSKIAVVGTGSDGTAPLWDGQTMQEGIHLRWFFEPSLGFPELGFEVFRRPSGPLGELSFGDIRTMLQAQPNSTLYLGDATISSEKKTNLVINQSPLGSLGLRMTTVDGPISISFPSPVWYLRVELEPEPNKRLKIRRSLGGVVSSTTVSSSRVLEGSLELYWIELSGDGWVTLCQFDTRSPDQDWGNPITSLCLPVTDERYPCHHPHADGTVNGDVAEAKARLPQHPFILDRYVNGQPGATVRPFRDELHPELGLHPELVAFATHSPAPPWIGRPTDPKLEHADHLDYVLLLSLDPYIARIAGVYCVDEEIKGQRIPWDYKVEGRWLKQGFRPADMPGLEGSQQASHRGFHLTSSVPAKLTTEKDAAVFEGGQVSVKIHLPPVHIQRITVFGDVSNWLFFKPFEIIATFGDGSVEHRQVPPLALTELATFQGTDVRTIDIVGDGTVLLRRLEYELEISHPHLESGYAYQLVPIEPRHLPAVPQGLNAWELKGWALSPPPDASGLNLNAVGLQWTPDTDLDESGEEMVPPAALLMNAEWYDFHTPPSQPAPTVSGKEQFEALNDGHPVLAVPAGRSPPAPALAEEAEAERRRRAALEFLITGHPPADPSQPKPPVDPLRYIHPRLPDGWHGYRLRTVDLFGRISPPGSVSTVKLQNRRLPPAPILLAARYLQQDEPPRLRRLLRTAGEDTWLKNNPSSNGLRVLWAWPPSSYHQAPKVLTFKIYGPDMEPKPVTVADPKNELSGTVAAITPGVVGGVSNVVHLKGTVTAVEPLGELVYRVATDAALPAGRTDAFNSARLLQGGTTYKVTGHTEGASVTLWVERSKPTDLAPMAGAFALDHSLLTTNVAFHGGAELLVGGSLSVGGHTSTVIAYHGGSVFLVRHNTAAALGTPPTAGRFSLLPFAGGTGAQAEIASSVEDLNTQTSRVELKVSPPAPPIPAGNILVGGVVEAGENSFEILENTASDLASGSAQVTLRWKDAQTRPQKGPCTMKAPSFATLEADKVLPGLATGPRKAGGWIEQESEDEQESEEFGVLGTWEDDSATTSAQKRTYFLVSYRAIASAPTKTGFSYFPAYETILPVEAQIAGASIVGAPTSFDATIRAVKEDSNAGTVTIATHRDDVACQLEALEAGTLQSGGISYYIKKATSLAPLTVVIEKPSPTTPLPALDSPCTLSGKASGIVVVKTDKTGKGWRWFAGGVLEQGGKRFPVAGSAGDAELLVMKLPDGSAPAPGPFEYRPVRGDEPTTQGQVSVTAVDQNGESAHSAPLSVTAVYHPGPLPPPDLPLTPPASGCILAEPADWYGRSSYTFSWPAKEGYLYKVYRAMDASLYDLDRRYRAQSSQPRTWAGGSTTITTADLPPRLQSDPQEPQIRQAIKKDFDDLDAKIAAWKSATTQQAQRLAELEQQYKKLRNDTHEVLAKLPYTAEAFALLTEEPIRPAIKGGGWTADFHDELPGSSSNRFFYRIATVDVAGNTSALSRPSPPVCCPDVTLPAPPVITRVLGGDRQATIFWASNREDDLKEYRVYRAKNEDAAGDLRSMILAHTTPVSPGDPAARPEELSWTDKPLQGLSMIYYRIVAVDNNGNVSSPSTTAVARAYDNSPPVPPKWDIVRWDEQSGVPIVFLRWSSSEADLTCTLQRRPAGGSIWQAVSRTLAPSTLGIWEFIDSTAVLGVTYEYRIQAIDGAGNASAAYNIYLLPARLM